MADTFQNEVPRYRKDFVPEQVAINLLTSRHADDVQVITCSEILSPPQRYFQKRTHVNSSGLNVYRELRQEMSPLVFNENVGISFNGLNVNVLMLVNSETARFPEQTEPSIFFAEYQSRRVFSKKINLLA